MKLTSSSKSGNCSFSLLRGVLFGRETNSLGVEYDADMNLFDGLVIPSVSSNDLLTSACIFNKYYKFLHIK